MIGFLSEGVGLGLNEAVGLPLKECVGPSLNEVLSLLNLPFHLVELPLHVMDDLSPHLKRFFWGRNFVDDLRCS